MVDRFARRYEVEPISTDFRSPARRDRDRILYSSAFRRLSGITQVVAPNERFPVHNRLSHSIKVAQVGRSIAERLLQEEPAHSSFLDADVVEASCLAHDLGHPPFGHNTERALDHLLQSNSRDNASDRVGDGFEGNAQTFRIVTVLSVRYQNEEFPGLNLCRATLNALLKYPWLRETDGTHSSKFGAYHSETLDFEFAREGAPKETQSVEAQLMDWADDVTYAVHDVEDFFRAGLVPLERLVDPADKLEKEAIIRLILERQKGKPGDFVEEDLDLAFKALRVGVPGVFRGSRADRASLRTYTSLWINEFVNAPRISVGNPASYAQLEIDRTVKARVAILKAMTTMYVIERPSVLSQRFGQRQVVEGLFNIYLTAATEVDQPDLAIFPTIFQERIQVLSIGERKLIKRLISDVIASMSEGQLIDTYMKLTGQSLGSAIDPIV